MTGVTTVVSLTLLRARLFAFAFLAKRDIKPITMSHFANALANANARISPPCSQKITTVVTLVTTTSFKALVGAQWLGLCPVSLLR